MGILSVYFQTHKKIQSAKGVDTRSRVFDYIIICHIPSDTVDAPLADCILTGRVQKPEKKPEKSAKKFSKLY